MSYNVRHRHHVVVGGFVGEYDYSCFEVILVARRVDVKNEQHRSGGCGDTPMVSLFPLKYSKFIHLVNNITGRNSLGEVIYRWSKTKDLDITQQLVHGVRYFDLRVAVDKHNRARIVHGLLGGQLDDILQQFKEFLL